MATRPDPWPQVSDALLPNVLFKLAEEYPDVVYAEFFAPSANIGDGYRRVTYRELANAVTAMAWWMEKNVGKPENDDGSETMVYFGPNDLRYGILVFASVMVGYKMLFPSPRYGAEPITKLISQVDAKIMLTSLPPLPIASAVLKVHPMKTYEIPSLADLLTSQPEQRYPFTKTFSQHRHEPLVALHTSGTTGFPKPIIWTHDWAASYAASIYLPVPPAFQGRDAWLYASHRRVMYLFPAFHASGMLGQLFIGLCSGSVNVYPPPALTPDAQMKNVLAALEWLGDEPERKCDWLALPPPHAEYLGAADGGEFLSRVARYVKKALWSGGDISISVGQAANKVMMLVPAMGSTELGSWAGMFPDRNIQANGRDDGADAQVENDWRYLHFHPDLNIRFDPVVVSEDGLVYEATMVKNQDGGWIQPLFWIHKDVEEYNLGDLFVRHPTGQHMWRHYGRSDDLLNFITSEKFHPAAAEGRLKAHPAVEDVMFVGTRRPRGALIVRLSQGTKVDDIWSVVEEVNEVAPVYARIGREMILVVDEPFPKSAAKGSILKNEMLELYKEKLDEMYEGRTIQY